MYPIKNIQCICICISIRPWTFHLCARRAASASAKRPSLIPSLLRYWEFLALASSRSQLSPSHDFFQQIYIFQRKLGCVGRFNVQCEAFACGWSCWKIPWSVVFHKGDETMKVCHELKDVGVHFSFVCMVKRLQMDEAILHSSLLPQLLVSAIKNKHCWVSLRRCRAEWLKSWSWKPKGEEGSRLLTHCLPTLQPIQILDVLCIPVASQRSNNSLNKWNFEFSGGEQKWINASLFGQQINTCFTYFVVSVATGTSHSSVFSISALIWVAVNCKR